MGIFKSIHTAKNSNCDQSFLYGHLKTQKIVTSQWLSMITRVCEKLLCYIDVTVSMSAQGLR